MLGMLGLGAPTWCCRHCVACLHQVPEKKEPRSYSCLVAPRGPGRWFHTWSWDSQANMQSDLISLWIFPAVSSCWVHHRLSPAFPIWTTGITIHLPRGKKNPSWNWPTVMEDPCLGPVESAEKKGRSRIYPHGTHSLRGKIQLLLMPPPKHAS